MGAAGMNWAKPSERYDGSCAEVFTDPTGEVGVRNSEVPGEVVWFTRDQWHDFVAAVRAGEFG